MELTIGNVALFSRKHLLSQLRSYHPPENWPWQLTEEREGKHPPNGDQVSLYFSTTTNVCRIRCPQAGQKAFRFLCTETHVEGQATHIERRWLDPEVLVPS